MPGVVHGMVRKTSVNTMFGRNWQAAGVVQIGLGTPASISKS
jgi:hypothetical protein